MIKKIKEWFRSFHKQPQEFDGDYFQVEITPEGKEANINDDFNKQIVIYRDRKRSRIVDYSPEDLKALRIVHPEMPLWVEDLSGDYEMVEGEYFGEVITG